MEFLGDSMSLFAKLNEDFSDDVKWLRKELVKKVLDENICTESYDLFGFFINGSGVISREFENEYTQIVYRIKSALPVSTTNEISGDIMAEIIDRESVWADGWAKYHEYHTAADNYNEKKADFDDYVKDIQTKHIGC
ncbi:uncharacterized protein METZ01_LOCUS146472 [marine metagenome]|uniref:Uncharacterized protein n=1 Tax=marine metagenome TaxID=408172 RepID=A0A381ZWE2_9ZZZZ